ncbi:hypothetical protein FZEAL_7471 [Fusarium zealandicum]|uniref:Sulfatase N-terminal domain-containing protein n=1 Tax=Fusarium zealandicum TaxID=1053134 RepID=A0A8H4XIU4_9HYPO|nr:hypothetical protein FZEAL_7471 [Fusarium zealandicum]
MALLSSLFISLLAIGGVQGNKGHDGSAKPNIVFLMTDDQDRLLGSMDYMPVLQKEMVAKGTQFTQHYTTTAQCCPSRVSLLRGQAAHNTNVTNVMSPGGNYDKFVVAGHNDDYLPMWLKKAGYNVEYIGKFLNGHNILNYNPGPKGWDHVDNLIEPYTLAVNNVVMSANGDTPISYPGFHQTDVVRAKAQEEPFFLTLTPTSPHTDTSVGDTVPCQRHMNLFTNVTAPRSPNYNPSDEIQKTAGGYIGTLPLLEGRNISFTDHHQRSRLQSLIGIDEMLEDILSLLEKKGVLENTYVVFTSDNGYHLGSHRMLAGKTTSYAEDTNLPLVVRGPGVSSGISSSLPGTHLDLAMTFLDIAGLPKNEYPPFLDGRSLLPQWHKPTMEYPGQGQGNAQEVMNVEYWGGHRFDTLDAQIYPNNSYKSLRIVGEEFAFLYNHWCYTNEQELYNTVDDPYEIHNLLHNPEAQVLRLADRLNAMLLVTKSCAEDTCRDPWKVLLAEMKQSCGMKDKITTLKQAMNPKYDDFFSSLPKVNIQRCLDFQDAKNEAPFLPAESEQLGRAYRLPTDTFAHTLILKALVEPNEEPQGTLEQRHATLEDIMSKARELTADELKPGQPSTPRLI